MPPDVKPDGQNVAWIPGYWAWDDGRQDFIWVSGIWRDTPPNHAWVAGYWAGANGGFQWTPGIWAPSNVEQVSALHQPPPTLENGPNVPRPDAERFFGSPARMNTSVQVGWPGYWTAQPGSGTPDRGTLRLDSRRIFVSPGHWDYELSHRILCAQSPSTRPVKASHLRCLWSGRGRRSGSDGRLLRSSELLPLLLRQFATDRHVEQGFIPGLPSAASASALVTIRCSRIIAGTTFAAIRAGIGE